MLVYALYLVGRRYGLSHSDLRTTIARYFFMSALNGRYTGSFETQIIQDVQAFTAAETGEEYLQYLRQAIDATLTPDYWSITLPQSLATSAARSPELFAYGASLCLLNARVPPFGHPGADGKQKASLYLRDLFDPVLQPKKSPIDRHHLFPRKYLERRSISSMRLVNQIANLAYLEWPDNIEVSDTAPEDYWPRYAAQFSAEDLFHHALPDGWDKLPYEEFLEARRKLIAQWRVLPTDRARAFHARVICDDDETYEVPPLNSILAGTVDSIRASEMPLEAFEDAWDEDGMPLAEYQTAS